MRTVPESEGGCMEEDLVWRFDHACRLALGVGDVH